MSEPALIPESARPRHVYIAGKSGYGKSTLIHRMALQDIEDGKGVCVIDPSGDLVKRLIHYIPKSRVPDCVWLDTLHPIPIDFFSYRNEKEREILTDDIILIFSKDTPNAPRMKGILRKLIPTLFEVNENPATQPLHRTSFLDIYSFFMNKKRREQILGYVSADRREYWKDNFPRPDAIEPIAYRMAAFTESPTLRTIFGTSDSKLNIWDAMQEGKILLVNIDINDTDRIFGTMLVAKMQQSAFRRRDLPESERRPFCLYVDEFENFQTSAFDTILSQGRKFQLWLTLAHQFVEQLDPKIKAAVHGTVSTFILFRMGAKGAASFRGELGYDHYGNPFDQSLPRLAVGEAIYRDAAGETSLINTPPPLPYSNASYAEIIRKQTVDKYACRTAQEMPQLQNAPDHNSKTNEETPKAIPKNKRTFRRSGGSI